MTKLIKMVRLPLNLPYNTIREFRGIVKGKGNMERLTERVLGFAQIKECGNDFCKETCAEHEEDKDCNRCPIQKAIEKLTQYEDLEEQGKLLKLPCKAGQKVYLLRKDIKSVIDGEITSIGICEFTMGMRIFITDDNRYTNASFDKIGEIVFFTQEEAEAALKEL